MKSILALIVLVAVANAGVIKEGGLKGSWADEIIVNSAAADLVAPLVSYAGTINALDDYWSYFPGFETSFMANVSDTIGVYDGNYYADTATVYFYFQITNELLWGQNTWFNQADSGGVEVSFWTGTAPNTHTLPTTCSTDEDDNIVTCTITIRDHVYGGVYNPMITVWDLNGNWATYNQDAFAVEIDQADFELISTNPDMTPPVLTAGTVSDAAIVLGMDAVLQNTAVGGQTIISVEVNDGSVDYDTIGTDAAAHSDDNGSGIWGVWATISTGTGDDLMSEDIALYYENTITTSGNRRYAAALSFANFAEPAVWTVTLWATDYASNVGTFAPATPLMITVTYDDTMLNDEGGVFSCQSLDLYVDDIFTYDNEVTVTATAYDTVYFIGMCTEKTETSDNYVAVAYTSDVYMTTGATTPMTQTIWNQYGGSNYGRTNMGQGVSWSMSWEDSYASWDYPGVYVSTGGSWSDTLYVQPTAPEVSYWLTEMFTITSTGGVQRYNLADGAASSVAPSVFAVAVAAAVALFRL